MYVPLHAHTATGSIGDSTLKTEDYIQKAKEIGLSRIAVTDHGTMASMVEFRELCKDAAITGIIGMEAYVVDDRTKKEAKELYEYSHLVLLAKDAQGVKNLLRIHNDAQTTGFYGKPRTDLSVLREFGNHIIGLSACVAGEIPKAILARDEKTAIQKIHDYKECFDSFWLEIQPGKFKDQITANNGLLYLSHKTGTPVVATNDIHYLNAEDYVMHNLHVKSIRDMDNVGNIEKDLVYPDTCYYLMKEDELVEAFTRTAFVTDEIVSRAIENTNLVAEQCDGEIDYRFMMPKYQDLPEEETEAGLLEKLCFRELKALEQQLESPSVYAERLVHELDVIEELGFCGYFLVVEDFLDYARSAGIAVGPGRGSVAGSLVAYLLHISVADPVKHHLMFERFLSANRKSLVDIDLDFSDAQKMKEYAIGKYGKDHCALVGTFGGRKARNAIRGAARLLGEPVETGDTICKTIPPRMCGDHGEDIKDPTIAQLLAGSDEFRKMKEKFPKVIDVAVSMESFPISMGIHAAGIVISPDSLMDKLPIRMNKATGMYVSLITKDWIEKVACKYDFLSLATMEVVDRTAKSCGAAIHLDEDSFYTDQKVWDAIGSRHTIGMFQISSATYRQRMKRLRPRNLGELAACLALVRGPCIAAHTDETYMRIVEGKQSIEKIDPRYDRLTEKTNGICIYQEQVMQIGMAFGFTVDEAYDLMKALSKKKLGRIRNMKGKFHENASKMDVPEKTQEKLWKIFEDASLYSFNMGHAMSYGIITYLSAWLKVHYPKEFMANLLTNTYVAGKGEDRIREAADECRRLGLRFLPPDINKSQWEFVPEPDGIRIGLCAVKAFGNKAAVAIEKFRPVKSFEGFLAEAIKKGSGINKLRIAALIFSGCFEQFGSPRSLLEIMHKERKKDVPEVYNLCKGCSLSVTDLPKETEEKLLRYNYVHSPVARFPVTGFPDAGSGQVIEAILYVDRKREIKDRNGNRMAFLSLLGRDCSIEGTVFASLYRKLPKNIEGVTVNAKIKKDKENRAIVLEIRKGGIKAA